MRFDGVSGLEQDFSEMIIRSFFTEESNEYAFLDADSLNPQWKLEITSKEGWMKNKENRKN